MALRRRRKKLTSLLSSVDRRLKNVELKNSKGSTTTVVANPNSNIIEPPPGATNSNSPNPWIKVAGGYWYPAQTTGAASGLDRVELWFEADPLIEKGLGITVSGVDVTGSYANPSGTYSVMGDDAPAGTARKSWMVAPGNTITHTGYYTTGSTTTNFPYLYGYSTNATLKTRAAITSTQATTTVATLNFSGGHHFNAGDIISVSDLGPASPYYGIDGIFKVASVPSSTQLTYAFDTALSASQSLTTVTSKYAYGVAQKEVRVGATWVNTTDGLTYYWNGIRYVLWTEGALASDGVAPSPPTSLNLSTAGYNLQGGASGARSRVTLSWTAPTTNVNTKPLDDLVGYRIWYRDSPSADWIKLSYGSETTQTIENLVPGITYYFEVLAFDSSGMESTHLAGNITTGTAALDGGVGVPSAPILSAPRLGTVTVTWDGNNADGTTTTLSKLNYLEVHASTTSGFTPVSGAATATVTTASGNGTTTMTYNTSSAHGFTAGQTITITGLSTAQYNLTNVVIALVTGSTTFTVTNAAASVGTTITGQTGLARTGTLKGKIYSNTDSIIVSDLSYNVAYYFKFISIDVSGNATAASAQATTTIKPLVDADLIAAKLNAPLSNWPFANAAVTPGALASGALNSSNLFGANVIVQTAIAANAIGADQIAAGAVVAGKILANSITAAKIDALAINAVHINTNAVEADKINAGAVTAVKIDAGAVTAAKILATDTFTYQNTINTESAKLGANSIPSVSGTPGLAIYDLTVSSTVPSGWFGGWGGGSIELGADFSACYIDLTKSTKQIATLADTIFSYGNITNYVGGTDVQIGDVGANTTISSKLYASGLTGSSTAGQPLQWSTTTNQVYRNTSSIRYKTEVKDLELDYDKFTSIKIRSFYNKEEYAELGENATLNYGYIAEELEADGFEKLVVYIEDKKNKKLIPESVAFFELSAVTHWAVNIQADKIKSLEARVAALEAKLNNGTN
jgi:hypothetical protein